jgi:hypothetical protein
MLQKGMADLNPAFAHLSNREVIAEVNRLAGVEREATAQLVAALAELDARRLYLGEGCASLFTYCTTVLHLSEHAAYSRIEAARAGRKFPLILQLLFKGDITVTTVGLLGGLLTEENHRNVLAQASHRSKREVEALVARLRPRPDVPPSVRSLPVSRRPVSAALVAAPGAPIPVQSQPPRASAHAAPEATGPQGAIPRPTVAPLAPERYKVQFTVNQETHDKLRRVQDLLRHSVPNGDIALIFDRALTALLAKLEKTKFAATSRAMSRQPSAAGTRHIPAAVRRAVWKRDGGQCAFRGSRGRCQETGFLEFHHVRPFAAGGVASEENTELRCRAHNQYEAELFFGDSLIVRESEVCYGVDSVWSGPSRVRLTR